VHAAPYLDVGWPVVAFLRGIVADNVVEHLIGESQTA